MDELHLEVADYRDLGHWHRRLMDAGADLRLIDQGL
jgi:hypothetical protein